MASTTGWYAAWIALLEGPKEISMHAKLKGIAVPQR